MDSVTMLQGRSLTRADIDFVRQLIADNPSWSRRKLSVAISTAWDWYNASGQLKDMACRSLLLKLHARGDIELPARRQVPTSRMTTRRIAEVAHSTTPIQDDLRSLQPLHIIDVRQQRDYESLYNCLLSRYHYLGYSGPVGENMQYLVVDAFHRPLACLLFSASAWACASRDAAIGWDNAARQRNLALTANNSRFLILPWVKVPHLASHVLALVSRRIASDWQSRYGHPLYLLETFVDQARFAGTCYRAANWHCVGQTRGRSRNDRYTQLQVPVKSVFFYPLTLDYQARLTA